VEIRGDFKSVEMLLARLVQYAAVFHENNYKNWSRLRNQEDFDRVYTLNWEQRGPLEAIYCEGCDLAVFMSSQLTAFNYVAAWLCRRITRFVAVSGTYAMGVRIVRRGGEAAVIRCNRIDPSVSMV
jgi:hypothetical protein